MRPVLVLRMLAAALAVSALSLAGCSSDATEDESDEGALEGPKSFAFKVTSQREKSGDVEPVNAYWASRLADISYSVDTDPQLKAAFEKIGLSAVEAFPFHAEKSINPLETRGVTGTDGFYVRTRDAGFLVFRGSEEKVNDSIADLRFIQLPVGPISNNAGDGSAHAGFTNALESVWGDLHDKLKARHGDGKLPLNVIGHSLGGGIAMIAMHHLLFDGCLSNRLRHIDVLSLCERDYIPVRAVYSFGSPRIGNEAFANALVKRTRETGTKVFRFVNEGDEVSMLPRYSPVVGPAYRHFGENGDERAYAVFLDHEGTLTRAPNGRCAENDKMVQCDVHLEDLVANALEHKFPWKVEHSRRLYIEKIRALLTSTKAELAPIRDAITQGKEPPEP